MPRRNKTRVTTHSQTKSKSYLDSRLFQQDMSEKARTENGTLASAPADNNFADFAGFASGSDLCPDPKFLKWCMQLTYLSLNVTVARQLIPDQKTVCTTAKDILGVSRTTCTEQNVPYDVTLRQLADCLNKNKTDAAVSGTLGSMPPETVGTIKAPCEFEQRAGFQRIRVKIKTSPISRTQCAAVQNRIMADIDQCIAISTSGSLELLWLLVLIVIPITVVGVCLYRKAKHGTTISEQIKECCDRRIGRGP